MDKSTRHLPARLLPRRLRGGDGGFPRPGEVRGFQLERRQLGAKAHRLLARRVRLPSARRELHAERRFVRFDPGSIGLGRDARARSRRTGRRGE